MKRKYTSISKAELIKKIKQLEADNKKKGKSLSSEIEELNHKLQLKEIQIENQKFELLDKQIQLESSRDKYADLYDFAPTGYITLNSNGELEEINLTGASMLGVETTDAIKIPFIHFLIKDDIKRFLDFIRKCKDSSDQCVEEFALTNKKNRNIIVQLTALSYQNYRSKKISFRISISAITERRKIEKAKQESEERFRLMADASPALIWMTDKNNSLEYMNKTKMNFLGINSSDNLTTDQWLDTRHPEDKEKFITQLANSSGEKKNFSTEVRVRDKNGNYKWLLESAAPRFLPDGTFIGYICSAVDITERKESRIKLENSLKEKEILLKEIHHRVKNNLQVMSSLLNLQRGFINDEKVLNFFKSSQSRISAMALLHENLYNSKNLSSINFKDYVSSISNSLLETYRNTARDVRINVNVEDIELDLDTSINFGLIINELVSNCLKYAFRGKKKGRINISLNKKNNNDLILKVSDNGIGLPDDFDIKKRKSLGLELVSNIVEQIHGKLEISKNGKTEFRIYVNDVVNSGQ